MRHAGDLSQFECADFDGDGDTDFVARGEFGTFSVVENGRDGFAETSFSPELLIHRFFPLDLDQDGDVDLLTQHAADPLGNTLSAFLSDGQGDFGSALPVTDQAGVPVPGDFDGDHIPDVVIVSSGALDFLRGNGDGTFGARATYPAGGAAPGSLVAGDWDADGEQDLAVQLPGRIAYWSGNGDGTFQAAVDHAAAGTFFGPHSVSDLDGDGAPDLLTSDAVLLGGGDGSFAPALTHELGIEDALDMDGDGLLDLVKASPGVLELHIGHGDGTFASPFTYPLPVEEYDVTTTLGDFDGDGDGDVLARYADSLTSSFLIRGRHAP